jgi:hypothetical protein
MNNSLGPQLTRHRRERTIPDRRIFHRAHGVRRRRRLHTQRQIAVMYNLDISALPPPSK